VYPLSEHEIPGCKSPVGVFCV